MRTRYVVSSMIGVVAALGAACGGDSPTGAVGAGTMSAMIGDTLPWRANLSISATLSADSVLEIVGLERTGKYVKLNIRQVAVDTQAVNLSRVFDFTFANDETTGYAFFSEDTQNQFTTDNPGGSGRITISLLSPTQVQGTFSFIAARGAGFDPIRRLAQGRFNVRLQ
ncbi:MAG TPA: hypothetical protein VJR92_03255 [Gemmatimonadaceae bacterium]|nr:hypothetical protein [Gemmatimonadaceae bacterium]